MSQNKTYQELGTIRESVNKDEVLHVVGEVDMSSAPAFEAALKSAATFGKPVVIDLRECTYLDSSGLSVLVRTMKRYHVPFRAIVLEGSSVERVFNIVDFSQFLQIDVIGRFC